MHHSLTSREQDLASLPKRQALLKVLGVGSMAKSQTHAAARHESLRKGSNDHPHSKVHRDPKGFIRRASPDMTLTPAQRKADERADKEYLRKMSAARANDGVVSDEDDEEMVDGVPVSPCSLSKSLHVGAFIRLRKGLHSFLKAQSSDHIDDFATRYGMPAAHVAHVAGRPAVAKPTIAALSKSIEATRQRVEKTLGISPMRHVAKKIATTATIAKSLPAGLRISAPQYSASQVEAAAGAALAHGAIDAQSAQVIANSLALGGVGAVPSALMAKLRGE